MRKLLFISNICKKISNFHLVSIEAAEQLGYEFHFAANFSEMSEEIKKEYPNIHFHQINLKRFPFNPQNIQAYAELNKVIEKIEPEAIHCNTPIGGALGRLCGARNKVEIIIYTAHGFHFYKGAKGFGPFVYKVLETIMARKTDVLITMNQEDYNAALKMKLKKDGKVFNVHGVGVSTDEYQIMDATSNDKRAELGLSPDDIVCIAMGDLIKRKNYETSIKAISLLNDEKVHFLICGKGPQKETLEALAKKLNVEKQIHFLGFRDDIKTLLNISDIFLFSSYQEGLPRSLMEAMASGLPCIVSNIRGNVDLVENGVNGLLCSANDELAFCNAMRKIILDQNIRGMMRKKNLEIIKQFDVKNVKKEMLDIYSLILK